MGEAVEMLISNKNLSKDNLKRIIKEYERLQDHQPTVETCFEMEKLIAEQLIGKAMRDPQELSIITPEPLLPQEVELVRRYGPQMKQTYKESFKAFERWLELPTWEAFKPQNNMKKYLQRLGDRGFLSRVFLTAPSSSRLRFTKLEAKNRGIIIFAAIKLYEKEKGHPPRNLKELDTEGYVSELPKDPFSGRDYIYKVNRNGWIVYSVFENLVDDGGAGSMPHNMEKEGKDKDLVWWSRRIPYKKWSW